MLHALRVAAERGLSGFELMGDAEAWIADLWTREAHECVRVRTYPASLAGVLAAAGDGAAWARGRLLKRSPWSLLRDARYALPRWIERRVPGETPAQAAGKLRRLRRPVSIGYFQSSSATPARPATGSPAARAPS